MTERKPAGTSFTSWIDQQISEAERRDVFDDLPGAGKPIPHRGAGDAEAWLQDYLRREWRRIPVGPPIFLSLVDAEKVVSNWRDRPSAVTPVPPSAPEGPAPPAGSTHPRWWHRLRRRQRDMPL